MLVCGPAFTELCQIITGAGAHINYVTLSNFCNSYAEPYQVSLTMDAVTKTNHFAHAGREANLEPHNKCFLDRGRNHKSSRSS